MSDISITLAELIPSAQAVITRVTYGEDIERGDTVYKNDAHQWVLSKADGATTYRAGGMATTDGSAGQPGLVLTADPAIQLGAEVAEGTLLAVSAANAGGMASHVDLVAGEYLYIFGIVRADNTAFLDFTNPLTTAAVLPAPPEEP